MNKHCNEYVLLFGDQGCRPDLHIKAAKYRFDFVKNARKSANKVSPFRGVCIYKVHYAKDSGDVMYIQEISR